MERRGKAPAPAPGAGAGPARRSPGSRRGCEGEAGAAAADGAVVQRTQVVLLAGEPWGLDGGQTVLNSFAHHVLPVAPAPPGQPGEPRRPGTGAPPPTPIPSSEGPGALPPSEAATGAAAAGPSGRLIFFLCRAASLRDREARLREVLRGLREQSRGAPAVLVGVVVQPAPDEEQGALGHLERLMREAVQEEEGEEEEGAPVEIHTAVFAPGRPGGALELRRLAKSHLRLSPAGSTIWPDKSRAMKMLGAAVSFGTLVYGGYYVCNNLLM